MVKLGFGNVCVKKADPQYFRPLILVICPRSKRSGQKENTKRDHQFVIETSTGHGFTSHFTKANRKIVNGYSFTKNSNW